jgi:hypothetical protein
MRIFLIFFFFSFIARGNDPALEKCFLKVLGDPNGIKECQKDPDYWSSKSYAQGDNTPHFSYDIFDGGKKKDCVSHPTVFTHDITDFSQIKELAPWGLTPQSYLKNHTYLFIKNKGYVGNKVRVDKPVPVYAPADSYLILQTRYRMEGFKHVQWRLIFQVGCHVVYRFDHLDRPSDRIMKHLGAIPIDENQVSAPNLPVRPPLKMKAGELIAHTKGTPQSGSWDFGVSDLRKNNSLPKRLKRFENKPTGRQFKYAACPYDYFEGALKKKYLKKMKGQSCGPN